MPVEISLIGVVDGPHIQKYISGDTPFQGRRNHRMEAVPAKIVGVLDTLPGPVFIQGKHLPGTVFKISLLPGGVVSLAETAAFYSDRLSAGRLCHYKCGHQQQGGKNLFHNKTTVNVLQDRQFQGLHLFCFRQKNFEK